MAKRFVVPFATSGDKSVTPDATALDGSISYSQGWPSAYQLADTDPNYRPVGRQEMNGVLFDITGALAELQTLGFPEWVAVTGLVTPYAINAYVRHNDLVWRNTIANNSAEPGGVGVTTWVDVTPPLHGIQRFTASGNFTVPVGVTTIYVSGCAGGGGGGASLATNSTSFVTGGSGGGAGQSVQTLAITVTPGQVIPVSIGAGGSGGTGAINNATAGAPTLLGAGGALLIMAGGSPGLLGGGGTAVPFNYGGPPGGAGFPNGDWADDTNVFAAGGSSATGGRGGRGGNTPFGNSGQPGKGSNGSNQPGGAGNGFGAGGSGSGGAYNSAVSVPGGAGAPGMPGLLIIEW